MSTEFESFSATSLNASDCIQETITTEFVEYFTNLSRPHTCRNTTSTSAQPASNAIVGGMSSSEIVMITVQSVIGLVGIVGNGFVIVVIAFYTTMHRQLANVFVVNQSAIDGLSSFIMIAMLASGSDSSWYTPSLVDGQFGSELYCRLWLSGFIQWSFFTSSTYNLVVLALERYVKIVYPIAYKTSFTKVKVRILLAFVWLFGLVYTGSYGIPTTIVSGNSCLVVMAWNNDVTKIVVSYLSVMVQYFIPALVFIVTYTKMVRSLNKSGTVSTAATQPQNGVGVSRDYRASRVRAQRNLIKTCILISASFFVCWSANEWYYFLYIIGLPLAHSGPIYNFTVIMVSLHCCINPFIYIANYGQFRNAVKKILIRPRVHPSSHTDGCS